MKLNRNLGLAAVGLGCVVALATSIYPGVLNGLLLPAIILSVVAVPSILIVGGCVIGWLVWKGRLRQVTIPWRHVGIALAMLLGTYTLLKFYVPRRVAFAASRSAFERFVEQVPNPGDGKRALNRRVGIYWVDDYASDPRGGTYFRVHSGIDGISPDTMSYGFCYQPNSNGSPFGAARYRTHRLSDDWSWFRASNDWY